MSEDSKKNNSILSLVLAFVVIIALIIFLVSLIKKKKNSTVEYSTIKNFDNFVDERARIYDRKSNALVVDEPVYYIFFDKDNYDKLSQSQQDEICRSVEEDFKKKNFKNEISKINNLTSLFVIDEDEKEEFFNKINDEKYHNTLLLKEYNKRIQESKLTNILRRYIGECNNVNRRGISGLEKLLDIKLSLPRINILTLDEKKKKHVYLTLDMSLCEEIDEVLQQNKTKTNVIVLDFKNATLLALGDNRRLNDESVVDDAYLFPLLDDLSIYYLPKIFSFIEADPTLLEDFNCYENENSVCSKEHGHVDLYNIINCKSAFDNLSNNFKALENDIKNISNNYNLQNCENTVAVKYVSDLIRLAYMAYSPDNCPKKDYLDIYESYRREKAKAARKGKKTSDDKAIEEIVFTKNEANNFILKIGDENILSDSEQRECFKNYDISPLGRKYLSVVLSNNICPELISFTVNDKYLVVAYQEYGINKEFISNLKNKLEKYK